MRLTDGALLSTGEALTDHVLRQFFGERPYLVYKEYPLRRVIEAGQNELTAGEWDYYTKACFDFVVSNRDCRQTFKMAVEFDGKQHRLRKQARKDALKDRFCQESGLPLLRVQADYVELREELTLLEYVLDLHFGETALEDLKWEGKVADDEEYFPGTQFPGTDRVRKRLLKLGICPAGAMVALQQHFGDDQAADILWYRVSDKNLSELPDKRSDRRIYKASVEVEVLQGWASETPLLKVVKVASLAECSPNRDLLGVHTWHLALQLAQYLAFAEVERLATRLGRRLSAESKTQ